MAAALVSGHKGGVSSSGAVSSVSFASSAFDTPGNVTAGNFLSVVAIVDDANKGGSAATVFSSNQSDTFTYSTNTPSQHVNISYVKSAVGGATTFTFTPTSGTAYCGLAVAEFSGVDSSTPADGTPSGDTGNTTNPPTPSIAPSNAGVLIAAVRINSARALTENGTGSTPSSGSVVIYEDESWSSIAASIVYAITTAGGTYNHVWTSATGGWWTAIAGYKEGTGGGGGRTTKNTRAWTHGVKVGMGHRMPV